MLAGMIARPRATSARTNSAGSPSRSAMNSISGVTVAAAARSASCVAARPASARRTAAAGAARDDLGVPARSIQDSRTAGRPTCTSTPCGPLVSYTRTRRAVGERDLPHRHADAARARRRTPCAISETRARSPPRSTARNWPSTEIMAPVRIRVHSHEEREGNEGHEAARLPVDSTAAGGGHDNPS